MDPSEYPFDIEAYKRQSEIEERYIVNRFKEQRNQIEEGDTPRVKRKYLNRDHAAANQILIDDYFVYQPTYVLQHMKVNLLEEIREQPPLFLKQLQLLFFTGAKIRITYICRD
jgi:hypothetical protein